MCFLKQFSVAFLFFIAFICNYSIAQDLPVEWEEIPIEDLQMKSYPQDTSASALILCDYGVNDFSNDLELVFTRHFRVKIFNENGYSFGTHIISLDDEEQYLDDLEAVTYWLDENGEMQSAELDDDDIKEEEVVNGRIHHKFTMPALRPGCIVDLLYTVKTKNIFWVEDWVFQYSEPVRWSEYRLIYLQNISYSAVYRGFEKFYVNERIEGSRVVSGRARSYSGTDIAKIYTLRYVVKDAPAVREEPFITCTADYKNRVEVQLGGWSIPGFGVERFLKDWDTFAKELLDFKWFGKKITTSGDVEDLAEELTRGITDPQQKMIKIYDWVRSSIVWDGSNRKSADKEMDEVIELKKGNSAEINFLLISLLRSAGVDCDPLVLSTRGNGRIQDLYPIESQFNYTIARAKAGQNYYYLDATDPHRPYDLIPFKLNNVKALVVKEGPAKWDQVSCSKKNVTICSAVLDLDEEGKLTGYFEGMFGEYNSLGIRDNFTSMQEKDVIKKVFDTELYGFQVDSFTVVNKDSITEPVKIKAYVTADNYAQINGDMIYLNPTVVFRMNENPLKTEKRNFPVDYGYKRGMTYIVNIKLPDGYEVKENLKNKSVYAGGSNLIYNRKVAIDGNQLQLQSKFDIKDIEIKPMNYANLREFYSQILALESEQIVLSKKIL